MNDYDINANLKIGNDNNEKANNNIDATTDNTDADYHHRANAYAPTE